MDNIGFMCTDENMCLFSIRYKLNETYSKNSNIEFMADFDY